MAPMRPPATLPARLLRPPTSLVNWASSLSVLSSAPKVSLAQAVAFSMSAGIDATKVASWSAEEVAEGEHEDDDEGEHAEHDDHGRHAASHPAREPSNGRLHGDGGQHGHDEREDDGAAVVDDELAERAIATMATASHPARHTLRRSKRTWTSTRRVSTSPDDDAPRRRPADADRSGPGVRWPDPCRGGHRGTAHALILQLGRPPSDVCSISYPRRRPCSLTVAQQVVLRPVLATFLSVGRAPIAQSAERFHGKEKV